MDDDARPARRTSLTLRRGDGVYELVNATGAVACSMNETAVALWELCDGTTAVGEMVHAVSELFQLEAAVAGADVRCTLDDLVAAGAVNVDVLDTVGSDGMADLPESDR